ncbi:hypothetical protein C8A01DRAFT_37399 [Parachaetomium inaequale]|uniref:UBZ4-type domain-containing protein n=1 Tax=Parachaetomium inaequale TaxID=2588326 RepID=A0AAN6SQK6_9PEZI|nr:hypothetical protein C8A01DRAFT_37399 [Parachaetomium inaequale]
MPGVPTTREVVPGALVNIVLKADQPTGRTVQGAVSQLLTRGNHPRGIKVRLADGRVGRVQSMAGGAAPVLGSADQPDGNVGMVAEAGPVGVSHSGRARHQGPRDVRDEEQPSSIQPIGLDAYIKPAKQRRKGRNAGNTNAPSEAATDDSLPGASAQADAPSPEQESTCPVCGDFRGDAAALTHHVQSHFDD